MTDKTENLEVSEIHEKNRFTNVNENSMYARRQKEKRKAQKNYVPGEYRRQLNMNSSGRDDKREQATRTANEIQDVSNKHSRTSDGGSHDSYESNCGKCGLKHRYRSIEIFMMENSEHDWYETLYIPASGKYLKFKLDTGAHVNVIPENIWRILKIGSLKKIKLNITNYGGQTLDVVGSYNLRVVFNVCTLILEEAESLMIILSCEAASSAGRNIEKECFKLQERLEMNSRSREELFKLSRIARSCNPNFTAANFFVINKSTILRIINLVTTYSIVMIQLKGNYEQYDKS
ncbi:hypothetical protein JTB14_013007 [Gonioctena quinquepunctata]|nr:hypothetical protein JTB14_013007 [Gonioctena quinquepunctata]